MARIRRISTDKIELFHINITGKRFVKKIGNLIIEAQNTDAKRQALLGAANLIDKLG